MNEQGVQKLLGSEVNLTSVAAGPVGRQPQRVTDAYSRAEILSYSRVQGLFSGVDFSGTVLRPDGDANRRVYGGTAGSRTILASRGLSAPPEAWAFLAALNDSASVNERPTATTGSSATAASDPGRAATTSSPTTDSDLRTRVVDMQQLVNRMLSDTPTSGGASGATTGNVVAIERARLLQLRDQIDALLTALNKR
jgi:hypothetical protein